MDFKDIIRRRRLELDMTMEDLAKLINVSTPTIQRYESGEIKNVRRDKIKLLADALQCSPGKLMGWESPEESVSGIINDRLKEIDMSLKEVSEKSGTSLYWLENIDAFVPGDFGDNETGYSWVTRVAEVIGLPGSILRIALAKQELSPPYKSDMPRLSAAKAFGKIITKHEGGFFSISDSEKKHIVKYRFIDDKGKHTVDTVLEMEYNRCNTADT